MSEIERTRRWVESDAVMEALIDRVVKLPADRQRQRPNAREFTPCELIEHMRLADAMYPPLLSAAQPGMRAKPNFLYRLVLKRMRGGGRVPAPKSLIPIEPIDLEASIAQWRINRAEIKRLTAATPPDAAALKHPLFGKMTVEQIIDLLDGHTAYHQRFFPNV